MSTNKQSVVERLKSRDQGIIDEQLMRKYAVFLPLVEKTGELHLLFEVRAKHMKRQPGEICFPGGRVDKSDRTPEDAAIRELCEELGISQDSAELTGSLDRMISHSNQIIYPFVGFLDKEASMTPNKEEVEELFTVPLSFFFQTEPERHDVTLKVEPDRSFPYENIPGGRNYPWKTGFIPEYFYFYKHYVIWGLTARIIKHFIEEIR